MIAKPKNFFLSSCSCFSPSQALSSFKLFKTQGPTFPLLPFFSAQTGVSQYLRKKRIPKHQELKNVKHTLTLYSPSSTQCLDLVGRCWDQGEAMVASKVVGGGEEWGGRTSPSFPSGQEQPNHQLSSDIVLIWIRSDVFLIILLQAAETFPLTQWSIVHKGEMQNLLKWFIATEGSHQSNAKGL